MKLIDGDILPMEVMARRENWTRGISIYARIRTVGAGSKVALPIVFKSHDEDFMAEPAMILPIQTAQQLMDELWQCGLRPSEGAGSAGSLAATERHLKDLRAVSMGLLKKFGVDVQA